MYRYIWTDDDSGHFSNTRNAPVTVGGIFPTSLHLVVAPPLGGEAYGEQHFQGKRSEP